MGGRGASLVSSAPEGPGEDEGGPGRRPEEKALQQVTDLGGRGHEGSLERQAAIGLVSFGLPQAERRRSAASLERKASAAMHKVM